MDICHTCCVVVLYRSRPYDAYNKSVPSSYDETKLCEAIRSSAHVRDATMCIGPIVIFSLPTGEQGNPKRTLQTSVKGLSHMIYEIVED